MNHTKICARALSIIKTGARMLSLLAAVAAVLGGTAVLAATHTSSSNVAVIPNYTGGGFGGGGAGTFNPAWFPGYTFTTKTPPMVASWTDLAAYDTVIIYQFCNINS